MRTRDDSFGTMNSDMLSIVVLFLLLIVFYFMITVSLNGRVEAMLEAQLQRAVYRAAAATVRAAGQEADLEILGKAVKKHKQEVELAKELAMEAQRERSKLEQENQAAEEEARRSKSVAVTIAIDGTGSVQKILPDLTRTIVNVTESMPEALVSFQIGFVVYRNGQLIKFPSTRVVRREIDGGASIDKVLAFVKSIESIGGKANIDEGVAQAMKQLDAIADGSKQCLMIAGDVACGEMGHHSASSNIRMIAAVRKWSQATDADRRVLALHVGADDAHRQVYQDLGSSNPKSVFGTSASDMFLLIFNAAFKD